MHSKFSSAICFDLDQSKIVSSRNRLIKTKDHINLPNILKNVLGHVLRIFLSLEPFESNTTSDWLNHNYGLANQMLLSNLQNLEGKDKNILKNGW